MYEKGSSKTQRDIEALSGTTMCGEMIEETDESVTIKTGNSLFEIPREFVKKVTQLESKEQRSVEVSISRDAKIVQKNLITAKEISGVYAVGADAVAAAYWPWYCYCYCYCFCFCLPWLNVQEQVQQVQQKVVNDVSTQFRKQINVQKMV